jgi:hypothetical protein
MKTEDKVTAHIKGAACFLEIQDQEGYYVFNHLSQTYLAIKYEEGTGTWVFIQQDPHSGKWTAVNTVPTTYNIGRKYRPTSIRAADIDDSEGSSTPGQVPQHQTTVSTTDMSQTALSTAAAALTLAGTTAPKQTTGFLGKGKKPAGQPPSGGGPPGGSGGGGLPGGPPGGGGPFRPPGGGAPGGAPGSGVHRGGNSKLGGNPPDVFNGDRATVDGFMNQFNLYHITNIDAEQMINPMKCAALFLGFIKGPNVKDWVKQWTNWTIDQFATGRPTHDEHYWNKVFHGFENAFRDTGTREHAEMCLNHLLMTQNEVDIFLVQFKSLAQEAQYPLDAPPTLSLLASKLPFHMMNHIYKVNRPQTFVDWANAICQYHQDNTAVQNLRGLHDDTLWKKNTMQQKGFSPQQLAKILGIKMPTPDANVMDTCADRSHSWRNNKGTKGCVSATAPSTSSKDTEKQCVEGRCFKCNKQGHMSRICRDPPRNARKWRSSGT